MLGWSILNRFDFTVSSWLAFNYIAFIVIILKKIKQIKKSRWLRYLFTLKVIIQWQIKQKKLRQTREIVNPHAAGIDVSSTEMQVCVPENRDSENNRRFGSFTEDLHYISSLLKTCGITTVAMESTDVYWVQLYMILEEAGFDVLLVNAKAIKNIGEKETDEVDAEWIMLLHSYGLLKASFLKWEPVTKR